MRWVLLSRLLPILGLVVGCAEPEVRPDPAAVVAAPGEGEAQPKSHEGRESRVEVALLNTSSARIEVTLPGEVEGSRDAMLAAALGGYVEGVHVKAGAKVKAGAALVHVDTATHSARLSQASVELESAKRELERAKGLGDSIPTIQLDAAETRVKAAKAAAWTAQLMVNRSVVAAPFDGVITDVNIEVGEVAAPGAPLLRLVKLDPIKVSVSLSDRDVVAIREGMTAHVSIEARAGQIDGVLKHLHRAADIRTRSFIAEVEVPNPEGHLLPGMIAQVRLEADVAEGKLVVAQDWLVTRINDIGAFVIEDGVARWRKVELGAVVQNRVVVEKGLASGDRLVITGHRELADGDHVIVAREGKCCTDGRVQF